MAVPRGIEPSFEDETTVLMIDEGTELLLFIVKMINQVIIIIFDLIYNL